MDPQKLRKQAMKIRHPTFTGGLTEDQKRIIGETADLMSEAARFIDRDSTLGFAIPEKEK